MSEERKPCPRFGGSDLGLMRIQEVQGLEWYQVLCRSCGHRVKWKNTTDDAIASWNEEGIV